MNNMQNLVCVYRDYILCSQHNACARCGWNPDVEAKRKEKLNAVEEEEDVH